MELVGELPASHHLASSPVMGGGGRVGPLMKLHRDSQQTLHHPNISLHISHAIQTEKCTAAPLHHHFHLSFFPSLSCSVLARPWATVPSSHTPAG